jgi:hypothetical protein
MVHILRQGESGVPIARLCRQHQTHVHLGMIETECLDLDDDVAGQGLGLRQIRVDQADGAAELLQEDGSHGFPPVSWQLACSTRCTRRRARRWSQIQEARKSRIAAAISPA